MKQRFAILSACIFLSAPAAFALEVGLGDKVSAVRQSASELKASLARESARRHFRRIEKRRGREADFRGELKRLGLVFKRNCVFAGNAIVDNSYSQMEFINAGGASGGYARIRVWHHPRDRAAFGVEALPLLQVVGDPRAPDFELRTNSIADFMARTRDLADIEEKIEELKRTVGPVAAAEDDPGDCGGEDIQAVPIEVR